MRTGAWETPGLTGTSPRNTPAIARNNWGEQVERHGQRLVWDAEGQLAGIEQGGRRVASYQYDMRGVRVGKTVHAETGDTQTYYLYDAQRRLAAEADGQGRVVREYLYNGTRPYAMLEGGKTYAIYSDARGLPLVMLDEAQRVVWQGQWDDWGKGAPGIAEISLELRLAGQYHDAESGLYYNVHRYYDPGQGAYVSPDPLGERLNEHRYAYLNHDPLKGIDPLGLFEIQTVSLAGYLLISKNYTDGGHADIVNAAFALHRQQSGVAAGEILFSRAVINQVILNNYHTDALGDVLSLQSTAGQFNPSNHFDNPNIGVSADGSFNDLLNKFTNSLPPPSHNPTDDWIEDAIQQINKNRGAYGTVEDIPPSLFGSIFGGNLFDISEGIGRLGQNLHALADFYAHTNWVDSAARGGGCYQKLLYVAPSLPPSLAPNQFVEEIEYGFSTYYVIYEKVEVPTGMGKTGLWGETSNAGLFSGAVYDGVLGWDDTKTNTDKNYTHAYWNKDTASTPGGSVDLTEAEKAQIQAQGLSLWKAVAFIDINKDGNLGAGVTPVLGENFITDNGAWPTYSSDRVYVKKEITNTYELAMALAIQHSVQEVEKFYQAAESVKVGDKTMHEVFKMNDLQLSTAKIGYTTYPDKKSGYKE